MGQHGSGKGAHGGDGAPGDARRSADGGSPGDGHDGDAGARPAGAGSSGAGSAGAGSSGAGSSGAAGSEPPPDENWDSWRLRLTDYGIGILIALILTPLLGFAVLMAVSGDFRDFVLR
ncbi:hypothetical protein [Yinghuangia sp. YIM S09857]|uniref:hypothetical protein n=1 Tax=Yinghuangia sp. YIM S09857 TaxID=3436929 RepID=UPI003F53C2A1